MLKGVSQKVIEVVHTDNRYFEKAILFLRPGAQSEDRADLRARAGEYLSQIKYNPPKQPKQGVDWIGVLKAAAFVLTGVVATCLFFLL